MARRPDPPGSTERVQTGPREGDGTERVQTGPRGDDATVPVRRGARSERGDGTERVQTGPDALDEHTEGTERVRTGGASPDGASGRAAQPTQRFGRFLGVELLATGGMGELYLARETGIEGFEREVAVKTLLPHLSQDREFVTMFLDEARIAAQLNHPNIVQILELGEEDGRYFIAMEYVDGVNLADLLIEAAERDERGMPLEVALPIAIDVCSALDYAHDRKDRFGERLNIVHRDVSPQNVLIGYDGSVKLTDFGVAAAENKVHRTQSGTVKGKVTFMSPEQAQAHAVDRRSDVFALGIVLYVMLTGTHPFEPDDPPDGRDAGNIQTLIRIIEASAPNPRKLRSELPRALAKAVLKALAKKPASRFASAAELRSTLEEISADEKILSSRDAVVGYVARLVPDRVADWRTRTNVGAAPDQGAGVFKLADMDALRPETAEAVPVPPPLSPWAKVARRPALLLLAAAVLAVAIGGAAALWAGGGGSGRSAPDGSLNGAGTAVLVADSGAVVMGDAAGRVITWPAEDGGRDASGDAALLAFEGDAQGLASADGDVARGAFDDDGGSAMQFDGQALGAITLDSSPRTVVLVGGERLGRTPLDETPIPAGSHDVRLRSGRHGLDYRLPEKIVVQVGEHVDLGRITVPRGTVRFAVDPWARISLDGRQVGVTPMAPVALYPGMHRVTLRCGDGRGRNTVRRRVAVRPRSVSVVRHRFRSCQ